MSLFQKITCVFVSVWLLQACEVEERHPQKIGTFINHTSRNITVVIQPRDNISFDSLFIGAGIVAVTSGVDFDLKVPSIPDLPPDHKWSFFFFDTNGMERYDDSLSKRTLTRNPYEALNRIYLGRKIKTQAEIEKRNLVLEVKEEDLRK